jgi:sugar O-acyltransferase (sialic acid O-acetyltransferase NeuD family)
VGTDDDVEKYISLNYYFLIVIGQIGRSILREKIHNNLKDKEARLATVISPNAYVSKSAIIGEGTIVMHGAIINSHVVIGDDCTINSKALIEHDSEIADHCHISTGALINGEVFVDKGSFCGSGSIVIQGSLLPQNSFIKAGTRFNKKNKNKTAFLTTIFPIQKNYVDEFMKSLTSQTNQCFDLILLNDGYGDTSTLKLVYPEINIIELESENNIAKNRAALINFARLNRYDYAIFGDIDDYFSPDRVDVLESLLKKKDIIVNDFTTFDGNGVIERFYLSNRLSSGACINEFDVYEKNLFGFTNTAINLKKIVGIDFIFNPELIAVDWYFFSYLLSLGLTAEFTNKTHTYYRQHSQNVIGINEGQESELRNILTVKKLHYREMRKVSKVYDVFYQKISRIENLNLDKFNNIISHPLWWEKLDIQEI